VWKRRQSQEAFLLAVNPSASAPRELKLTKAESSIGSGESNSLVVRDDTVSQRHALVKQQGGKWQVIDNKSSNGTYVDGRRAIDWIRLRDGAEIRFGGAQFVFRSGKASETRSTPGLPSNTRASAFRPLAILIVVASVAGFGAAQYYLYRWYEAKAAGSPASASIKSSDASKPLAESNHPPPMRGPSWLERVNYWRTLAGLAAVSEAPDLSAAAVEHARYLVKHVVEGKGDELSGAGAHTEDPSDRWYTPGGLAAAQNADISTPCRDCMISSGPEHVDDLLAVPFHRLRILDPAAARIGFGSYTEAGLQGAVLYFPVPIEGADSFTAPIEFPPNGARVGLAVYQSGEWPDPLSSCPGYTPPTGLPITLELGRELAVNVTDHSLQTSGQTLASCVFSASTYNNPDQATETEAREILKNWGAVVLIPRQPLISGRTYVVSISANGGIHNWSFSVE
jgi:hypothetical protein